VTNDNGLSDENHTLMQVMDRINRRYPKAIASAATGFDKAWKPKAERISQHYTTDWKQLVYVKC
jgi:DNA polymerase V